MTEKLQKVLARAGFGSRREIETWIAKGRIKVNGKVAVVGDRVGDDDKVVVDGKKLAPQKSIREERRVILYNKPEDEVSTRDDPEGRRTVFDSLPPLKHGRWVSVGRLDLNTSGLMLFTTDGELANKLMHPSSQIEREYAVRVLGDVTPEMVAEMHEGVIIEDKLCRFTDIQHYGGEGVNQWYHVVLMEGRNREVRKLWESQGVKVSRLKRVRFGPLFIPSSVSRGRYNELGKTEIEKLLKLVNKEDERKGRKKPN
jgi:23S rRNA pseudouridine2605 synthase